MRLALIPLNPTVGDIAGNAGLIGDGIAKARDAGADIAVFPELCLCGYPPKDLLLQEGFVKACADAARVIGETDTRGITAVFGLPLPTATHATTRRGGVANALVVYRDNRFVDYYDKRLLPTYDVFDEDRYFEPGARAVRVELPGSARGRAGLAICEDLWRGQDAGFSSRYAQAPDPIDDLFRTASDSPHVLLSPSASPFVLGKSELHRAILRRHAVRHQTYVASVNQLGGNDDLVFDGHAFLYSPQGELVAAGKGFSDEPLVVDIPAGPAGLGALPPLADPASVCSLFGEPESLLFSALVLGVRDYLRKTGFSSAILGVSGGIDSALTAAIAAAAVGPANVLGVAMPSKYSSPGSITDAYALAENLGVPCITVPIEPPVDGFRGVLDEAFAARGRPALGEHLPDLTEENLQSRVRGSTLMALSNRTGAIVLTTGNKSELAVGYCTLYGDMNGGLAVLSDVTKQLVYRLSRWINANPARCGFRTPPIPLSSIEKPPSAELRPNQTDQDSLPPYDTLDEIIERYVERRQSELTIIQESGIDEQTVRRVLRLIDLSEYKRKQAAIGLKVTTVAFGSGRRWPIAQRWRP